MAALIIAVLAIILVIVIAIAVVIIVEVMVMAVVVGVVVVVLIPSDTKLAPIVHVKRQLIQHESLANTLARATDTARMNCQYI